MTITDKSKASTENRVKFNENVEIRAMEVEEEAEVVTDKKYSLDSDEEEEVRPVKRIKVDEVEGVEETTKRDDDGQKLTPFNLEDEEEEGYFDDTGNFVFNKEKNNIRDSWLDSIDTAKIAKLPQKEEREETPDPFAMLSPIEILEQIVTLLNKGESVAKALKRYGGTQLSASQRLKMKKKLKKGEKLPDTQSDKVSLEKLTTLADYMLNKGRDDIYQETYEKFSYEIEQASGDIFGDAEEGPSSKKQKVESEVVLDEVFWFYKVGDDMKGPLSSTDMLKMQKEGGFANNTEVCKATNKDLFYHVNRVDFDDYID